MKRRCIFQNRYIEDEAEDDEENEDDSSDEEESEHEQDNEAGVERKSRIVQKPADSSDEGEPEELHLHLEVDTENVVEEESDKLDLFNPAEETEPFAKTVEEAPTFVNFVSRLLL